MKMTMMSANEADDSLNEDEKDTGIMLTNRYLCPQETGLGTEIEGR